MLPSSVTRVKKSKATGDTLTFTAASVHTSFNNNTELKLGHVLKSFFGCFPVCYSANWLFQKSMLFNIIVVLTSKRKLLFRITLISSITYQTSQPILIFPHKSSGKQHNYSCVDKHSFKYVYIPFFIFIFYLFILILYIIIHFFF